MSLLVVNRYNHKRVKYTEDELLHFYQKKKLNPLPRFFNGMHLKFFNHKRKAEYKKFRREYTNKI